jgi:hypothetical protein
MAEGNPRQQQFVVANICSHMIHKEDPAQHSSSKQAGCVHLLVLPLMPPSVLMSAAQCDIHAMQQGQAMKTKQVLHCYVAKSLRYSTSEISRR